MANGADMKGTLDRIEAMIAEVKRQYDLFFQGGRRSEPSDKRREIEEIVRRTGQRKITNTNEQFRFNNLQTRFYSYSNLWARMLREMEEGQAVRTSVDAAVRGGAAAAQPVDPAHIDRVIGELIEVRRACGLPAGEEDSSATREVLLARARQIAEKSGARKVEFRVAIEGGKPKVKAVLR